MEIKQCPGVSPVHADTVRLAEIALTYNKHKVLDMGTGTGYIAVFLALAGAHVDATDINDDALQCVKDNANQNNIPVNVFTSDLFEKVHGKYDLIIFNPPIGGSEPKWQVKVKALIRKSVFKDLASRVISRLMYRKRIRFLERVIAGSSAHLEHDGILLMHIQSIDLPHLHRYHVVSKGKVFSHTEIVEVRL